MNFAVCELIDVYIVIAICLDLTPDLRCFPYNVYTYIHVHTLQFYNYTVDCPSLEKHSLCMQFCINYCVSSPGVLILLAGQVLSLFDADLEVMHNVLCSHHKNKMCKVQYYVCPESQGKNVVYIILKWL